MSEPRVITRQKVSAVLRKAGLNTAKWLKSSRVKNWGNWREGVRVRDHVNGGLIEVSYIRGSWSNLAIDDSETKISDALTNAKIEFTFDDGMFIIPWVQ